MDLSGTTALVTGAGSGLGRAIALELAGSVDAVWVTDLDLERAGAVAAEVEARGSRATVHHLDVSSWTSWRAALDTTGPVDLLVNNAGVADVGHLVDTEEGQWTRQLEVNLMGVVRGSRTYLPAMIDRQRGHILNIASMAGLALAPGMISYNTSKAAVVAFSESLRVEAALDSVGVGVCCPAFFRTNLTDSMASASPATVARVQRWMDRSGVTAEDVAAACVDAVRTNRFMVLTHPQSRRYWLLKRLWPERYRRQLLDGERTRRAKTRTR